jgi:AcrR family transcriptional regulator
MVVRLPAARRRRQLLDVALEVFAAKGFHATSMDEIAEAAGITKPVLYQHFASKRQLYRELLSDVGQQLMEEIAKAAAAAGSPHQQVAAGFRTYFRFVAEHPSAFELIFGSGARRDAEFSKSVRRVEQAVADAIASLITADVDDAHRQVLAFALVGAAEAVSRHAMSSGRPADPDLVARQVADLAWAGLRGVRRS